MTSLLVLLVAAACAQDFSGLQRTHVTKEKGRQPVVTKEDIKTTDVPTATSDEGPGTREAGAKGAVGGDEWTGARFLTEGGIDRTFIFSELKTSFSTPNSQSVHWNETVKLSGSGYHGGIYLSQNDVRIGLVGGRFLSSATTHDVSAGGIRATEIVDTDCVWIAAEAKLYPWPWVFYEFSTGALAYTVDTRVETNAQTFSYEGLSGLRGLWIGGAGLGLTTPERYRLQASIEGTLWLTNQQDPPIESGVAQVRGSVSFKF